MFSRFWVAAIRTLRLFWNAFFGGPITLFVVTWFSALALTVIFWTYRPSPGLFLSALPAMGLGFTLAMMLVEYPRCRKARPLRGGYAMGYILAGFHFAVALYLATAPLYTVRSKSWGSDYYYRFAGICMRGETIIGTIYNKNCNFIDLVKLWSSDSVKWIEAKEDVFECDETAEQKEVVYRGVTVNFRVLYHESFRLETISSLSKAGLNIYNCEGLFRQAIDNLIKAMLTNPNVNPRRIIEAVRVYDDPYYEISNVRVEIEYPSQVTLEVR